MDFGLTDEQELLRATARAMLGAACPASLVRAHAEDPSATDALWREHLSGWVVLGEGGAVDHALFAQEAGAVLAPGPWLASSLALRLLRTAGIEPELADRLAAGDTTATVALAGGDGQWRAADLAVGPLRRWVLEADRVDHIVAVGAAEVPGAGTVAVLERSALPEPPRLVETLDSSRRVFDLVLGPSSPQSDVPTTDVALDAIQEVLWRTWIVAAAELVGVARWLVDTAVAYARERVQFDRPIGSFQAVQHKLVDMSLEVERAEAATYAAAMLVDAADPAAARAVHVAKSAAGTAARCGARDGLQVLGGIGYTWEHDLHLYLRRAYAGDYLFGSASWHHDRLADLVL